MDFIAFPLAGGAPVCFDSAPAAGALRHVSAALALARATSP
jgi:hypothetical protein